MAALAAGCGTQAHQQALTVAKRYAAAHGLSGRVSCSNGIGGLHPRSADFVCDVRRSVAVCDELRVRRLHGAWRVTVRRRGVDCVLPA